MKDSFPIVPASSGPIWFCVILSLFVIAFVLLFGYIAYSARHTVFEVSPAGLRIAGALYGRRIPLSALNAEQAKPVDLARDQEYQPLLRTNGVGLPGYQAGWFRLRNGEKSLAFVTDRSHVLYVPTREGYSVLMSVADPGALLEALRKAIGR